MSRLISFSLSGVILMSLSACGSDLPAPDSVIREFAAARTARVKVMYEGRPVEWTIEDPDRIKELSSLIKTDGPISKPSERPGTNDVIQLFIADAAGEKSLFNLVDGNRFMYGPEHDLMVKLKDRDFHRALMVDAEKRLNSTPR